METEHNLPFEDAEWPLGKLMGFDEFRLFRIGTMEGLWRSTTASYDILALNNNIQGNGHLNDVFQWFENSCKRDNKEFRILEVINKRFAHHLIRKRGFKWKGNFLYKKVK